MLKRNGEICQHEVPEYPGLLTDSEQKAYTEAIASVEKLLTEFNAGATALSEVEKQIPKLEKVVAGDAAENTQSVVIRGQDSEWQIRQTLFKSARSELLLCSREAGLEKEFGIVERLNPNSLYAQAHGGSDLLMTSNNPSLLLQDYLENERRVLQMFREDIEATVEETLAEKFPGENHSRVVKAISARCGNQKSAEGQNVRGEKVARNVRIRF
jgi:hypothetical protein